MAAASPSKRRDMDIMKLMMSDYEVHIPDDSCMHDFYVKMRGPPETPYEGAFFKVHVTLPMEYPYKSPSIGFQNRIFHPNVDERSGSVCLDVINQTWSPMFDLVNIFDVFLPQLLRYPNPSDPLNGEAAVMLLRDPEAYGTRVREYVRIHASVDFSFDDENQKAVFSASSASSANHTTNGSQRSSSLEEEKMDLPDTNGDDEDVADNASEVSELSDL